MRLYYDTVRPSHILPVRSYFVQISLPGSQWHWRVDASVWKSSASPALRDGTPAILLLAQGVADSLSSAEEAAVNALYEFTDGDVRLLQITQVCEGAARLPAGRNQLRAIQELPQHVVFSL